MTTPCKNCPFRTDVKPYLKANRVRAIRRSLINAEFPCHKTIDYSEDLEGEDGDIMHLPGPNDIHCAGALILLEKIEEPSQMMRIAERIGMYDASKLDMDAPVYDSWEEMIEAQADFDPDEEEDDYDYEGGY